MRCRLAVPLYADAMRRSYKNEKSIREERKLSEKYSFELFVLQLPLALNKCSEMYLEMARSMAMSAFLSGDGHGETNVQLSKINECLDKRDMCRTFVARVKKTVDEMPRSQYRLIVELCFKHIHPQTIADKFGTSVSTVYRKLRRARKTLVDKLADNGVTKEWVIAEFGDIPLTRTVVETAHGKRMVFKPDLSSVGLAMQYYGAKN